MRSRSGEGGQVAIWSRSVTAPTGLRPLGAPASPGRRGPAGGRRRPRGPRRGPRRSRPGGGRPACQWPRPGWLANRRRPRWRPGPRPRPPDTTGRRGRWRPRPRPGPPACPRPPRPARPAPSRPPPPPRRRGRRAGVRGRLRPRTAPPARRSAAVPPHPGRPGRRPRRRPTGRRTWPTPPGRWLGPARTARPAATGLSARRPDGRQWPPVPVSRFRRLRCRSLRADVRKGMRVPQESTKRQQRAAATAEQLQAAAREVFESRGYAATTVGAITKAANTAHGTFYLHFKNKEDALGRVMEQVIDEMTAEARAPWAGDPYDQLLRVNRRYLEVFNSHKGLWRCLIE